MDLCMRSHRTRQMDVHVHASQKGGSSAPNEPPLHMRLQPLNWLPVGEQEKMSERTLEGRASRVRVTSSDDSRVDRIARA